MWNMMVQVPRGAPLLEKEDLTLVRSHAMLFAGIPDFLPSFRASGKNEFQENHVRPDASQTLSLNLEEYRIRASRLLKELRGTDLALGLRAANRFGILPGFEDKAPGDIYNSRDRLRRKHALTVIAREAGFEDWPELKDSISRAGDLGFDTRRLFQRTATFLNLWYRTYEQAREVLTEDPKRYLFPYRHQFVVCEGQLLADQGIDTADPDWERMGRDWVRPLDARARARLAVRLRRVVK